VDKDGLLWVAGNDSTRRWVKGFDLSTGILALQMAELPSKNSMDVPDPKGAPMINPVDVAFSPDGKTAYVPDAANRVVYKFKHSLPVSVSEAPARPQTFALEQNYPNPFNPSTTVTFSIPSPMHVRLVVTNVLGEEVQVLVDQELSAGKHIRLFEGVNLPSGVYFYTLSTESYRITRSMMLVR
jgi:hypothetical protein